MGNTNKKITGIPGFICFLKGSFPAKTYAIFAVLWYLALETSYFLVNGMQWNFSIKTVLGILVLFTILFFVRAADEIKDYEYDKINNPDRPLITGEVKRLDLWIYILLAFIIVGALTAGSSLIAMAAFMLDMMYGLFLMWIEKVSVKIKDGIFANLLITYPINVGLSLCFGIWVYECYGIPWNYNGIFVILIFATGFLFFEFIRKTSWKKQETKNLYSNLIGGKKSLTAAVIFGLLGIAFSIGLIWFVDEGQPWTYLLYLLPAAAIIPVLKAVGYFWSFKERKEELALSKMGYYGRVYIVVLYAGISLRVILGQILHI